MKPVHNLNPEEFAKRTHEHAVKCADHFKRIGRKIGHPATEKKIDFNSKSIEEIDMWIADVTTALGIRQFNK